MATTRAISNWQLYIHLLGYLKDYWKAFVASVVSMLVVAATMPAFGYLLKPLINEGFVDKNMQEMAWPSLAVVGLFPVRGVFNFFNDHCTTYLSGSLVDRIRREMFTKMMRLSSSYYGGNAGGRLVSRVLNDAGQITEAGFNVITVIAKDGASVVGLLGLLMYLNWQLTLIIFAVLPVATASARIASKRLRRLSQGNQQYLGQTTQVLNESINGVRVIKVCGGQSYEADRFGRISTDVRRNLVKQVAASSTGTSFTQLMVSVALAVIICTAARQVSSSDFNAGDFMFFPSNMITMFGPVERMTGVMQSLQRGLAAADSVFTFLDEPEEDDGGKAVLDASTGDIEFSGVYHRCPEAEHNSLNSIDSTVPQGKVVALVGASGCGKTTLANMLPRFLDSAGGAVRIGGENIRNYTLENLRGHIAPISQDMVLFSDTITQNIAHGRSGDMSGDEIIRAAQAVNAWNFVQAMPQGLQIEIGENGLKLSGGQRQRVAIARALPRNAPTLILGEATSTLNNESERLVQAALENPMQNRTTIVIAHRLSTIEKADNIVVMHEGCIVEQGTYDELLAKGGRYADLYSLQSDGSQEPAQRSGYTVKFKLWT